MIRKKVYTFVRQEGLNIWILFLPALSVLVTRYKKNGNKISTIFVNTFKISIVFMVHVLLLHV